MSSLILSQSTNIQNINDPMSIISQLNPKSYTFKQPDYESMMLPSGTHFGILAQEMESMDFFRQKINKYILIL